MKKQEITNNLNIFHNLDENLKKEVKKKHDQKHDIREDDSLNYTQAVLLSAIDDKKEQKELAKALKNSQEQRVREQTKLISSYKELDETKPEEKRIRDEVRRQKLDLKDVPVERFKLKIKEKADAQKGKEIKTKELKQFIREGENLIGGTNAEIFKTCAFFEGLTKTRLIHKLDWNTIYDMLESAQKGGNQYSKFVKRIMDKL